MTKAYRILLPLLGLWLAAWMWLSWAATQDDALIHLRYADNLFRYHFITYDGVHPDYGASSLLYVGLLAMLRGVTPSPNLPRAVSSVVHCFLFAGLAYGFVFRLPKSARVARLAGLVLLVLAVTPSAVRWLDDGMETGLVVTLVSLLAWQMHALAVSDKAVGGRRFVALIMLTLLTVLLRTELLLLCGFGFLLIAVSGTEQQSRLLRRRDSVLRGMPLLIGTGLALSCIVASMHVLLPDTAIAKSHGLSHWLNPVHDAAITLGGAFSFGVGMLAFWLLTLLLVLLQRGRFSLSIVLANSLFPVVLVLASLRGQEIQGVRYFAWTFFFPVVWNILELSHLAEGVVVVKWPGSRCALLLAVFLVLLVMAMPFEARSMFHVLSRRSETVRIFETQHLEVLRDRRGIASDIGYIGYFSGAQICDLAGLVNGRAAARLTSDARNLACVRTEPDFIFGNVSQLGSLTGLADLSGWQVCGRYDFTNVRSLDSHFLVVRPLIAEEVCRATGNRSEPLTHLLAAHS